MRCDYYNHQPRTPPGGTPRGVAGPDRHPIPNDIAYMIDVSANARFDIDNVHNLLDYELDTNAKDSNGHHLLMPRFHRTRAKTTA